MVMVPGAQNAGRAKLAECTRARDELQAAGRRTREQMTTRLEERYYMHRRVDEANAGPHES